MRRLNVDPVDGSPAAVRRLLEETRRALDADNVAGVAVVVVSTAGEVATNWQTRPGSAGGEMGWISLVGGAHLLAQRIVDSSETRDGGPPGGES